MKAYTLDSQKQLGRMISENGRRTSKPRLDALLNSGRAQFNSFCGWSLG